MTAWLPNVVPDAPIESAWGNTIRDRTATPFANAAARTTAIPVPKPGQLSWLMDVKRVEIYDGAAWQPYSPGAGQLAYKAQTADVQAVQTFADIPGLSATVTVPAGRRIQVTANLQLARGASEASGGAWPVITDAANISIAQRVVYVPQNFGMPAFVQVRISPNAGTYTWKARIQSLSTSWITAQVGYGAWLAVDDVGPATMPA